jgi:hypothetical protein
MQQQYSITTADHVKNSGIADGTWMHYKIQMVLANGTVIPMLWSPKKESQERHKDICWANGPRATVQDYGFLQPQESSTPITSLDPLCINHKVTNREFF